MANQETEVLDDVIVSTRRKMLALGGAAIAGLAFAGVKTQPAEAQTTTPAYSDADILNFALNLEYLEAQFYTLATAGTTIDQMGVGIGAGTSATGGGSVSILGSTPSSCLVNWQVPAIQAYATETANEERNHVTFLRSALGSSAVAQPNLNLGSSFTSLGNAIGLPIEFNPFANDYFFLLGAFIFEDVGVTAYSGAAPLITTPAYLTAAAGILAVEAYHAGLIRTSIVGAAEALASYDIVLPTITQLIAAKRMSLDGSTTTDDIGVGLQQVKLEGSTALTASTVVDATTGSPNYSKAFARSTTQVLKIVTTNTNLPSSGTKFMGGFFPNGLNSNLAPGLFS